MARPLVYTNAVIMEALRDRKGLVYLASRKLGCDPHTIYERAKRSPEVAACIASQRGEVVDTGEMRLFEAVDRGEPWAVGMVLKTLGRDRGYGDTVKVQGAGENGEIVVKTIGGGAKASDV